MTHPIPGKDAHWCGYCPRCDDSTLFASRGGFKNKGTEHCYDCGLEKETTGVKETDIKRMIMSSYYHWKKYPLLPYNWHTLTENKKWEILGFSKI